MAFKIFGLTPDDLAGETLLTGMFGCYDTISDPDYDYDRDECLHERSAYEMVRDQLTDDQRAELDTVDAYWQARPAEFNAAFGVWHHQSDRQTALAGFVEDEQGETPSVPRSHWWWKPLGADE